MSYARIWKLSSAAYILSTFLGRDLSWVSYQPHLIFRDRSVCGGHREVGKSIPVFVRPSRSTSMPEMQALWLCAIILHKLSQEDKAIT